MGCPISLRAICTSNVEALPLLNLADLLSFVRRYHFDGELLLLRKSILVPLLHMRSSNRLMQRFRCRRGNSLLRVRMISCVVRIFVCPLWFAPRLVMFAGARVCILLLGLHTPLLRCVVFWLEFPSFGRCVRVHLTTFGQLIALAKSCRSLIFRSAIPF